MPGEGGIHPISSNQGIATWGILEEAIYRMIESDFQVPLDIAKDKPARIELFKSLARAAGLGPSRACLRIAPIAITSYILSSQDPALIRCLLDEWKLSGNFQLIDYLGRYENKLDAIPDLTSLVGAEASRIFHFEDNAQAIEISRSAGHRTIFVRNAFNEGQRPRADWIIHDSTGVK